MAVKTTYRVGGYIANAPAQNRAEEWDGGAGTYTAWDASGNVTTSRPLTQSELDLLAASDNSITSATNQSTIRQQAQAALAANTTYIGIASPTTAQVAAQVKALTQQNNRLIRLALNQFDATN